MTTLRSIAVLFALTALPSLTSCVISANSDTEECGRRVDPGLLGHVQPGMTTEQVRELLGDPSERRRGEDGTQLWLWSYRKEEKSRTAILFLFGGSDTETFTQTTTVESRDGVVVRAWQS